MIDAISESLTADIGEVSTTGIVEVSFSEFILIPSNYSWFNNEVSPVLSIVMSDADGNIIEEAIDDWVITIIHKDRIVIQLTFSDPY